MSFRPNQFRDAATVTTPGEYREGRWHTFEPRPPVERHLRGKPWLLRPGLTFTPYANPRPCNAHCPFCSEELLRADADRLTAKTVIEDHDRYFAGLARAWGELDGFPMGLSLSGLEATADPAWLKRLLALIDAHGPLFPLRVLYTNGSGLCTDPSLVEALARTRFDRIEISRCHFDEKVNLRLMRYDRDEPVRTHEAFAAMVRRVQAAGLEVTLVCILNSQGVATIEDVERHLAGARELGVRRVVFRALSELGDLYRENRASRWIGLHRVTARGLMEAVFPAEGALREGWTFVGLTAGYYYYNEAYRWSDVEVILEGASYVAHHERVRTDVLQKLVFHSTGDLCGDWVPNAQVVGNYFAP